MSSSSIPDGISLSQLQKLAESASTEGLLPDETSMSEQEMMNLVSTSIEELTDKFESMFGYKLAAIYCLRVLFEYHNDVHRKACEDGEYDSALAWARDAGWFQVMINSLINVCVGEDDFISPKD